MAFVRAIVAAYQRYDKDPSAVLRQAQIAPEQVPKLDARITAWQMETLSGAAMQELDDEALGWFSRRLPWGSYGMLARASISAPTLQLALARWCRHHSLIAPDIALSLDVSGEVATIRITECLAAREGCAAGDSAPCPPPALRAPPLPAQNPQPRSLPANIREFCLVSVLRNIHGLACWLVRSFRLPHRRTLAPTPFCFLALRLSAAAQPASNSTPST